MNVLERVKHELKYNAGPAIAYVKVGKQDAQTLVKLAEENQARLDLQTAQKIVELATENARLRKALEFYENATPPTIDELIAEGKRVREGD